jgi:hypothetical protein
VTSFLRKRTAPEWLADHERRIDRLERRLGASPTELPRRLALPDGAAVVVFVNSTGAIDGSGWHSFDQQYALGDTSWFEFPPSYAPADHSRIWVKAPGIGVVTLAVYYAGVTVDAGTESYVDAGPDAQIARATVTAHGSGRFAYNQLTIDTVFPELRANGPAANFVSSVLTIQFYPGEYTVTTP